VVAPPLECLGGTIEAFWGGATTPEASGVAQATPGGHSEVVAATSGSTVGGRPPTSLFQKIYGFFFLFFFFKKKYI